MAQNRLGGPGLGLPFPSALYPAFLSGAAPTAATNLFTLAPGQAMPVPPGDYLVNSANLLTVLQYLDPVTGTWLDTQALNGPEYIHSDGQNIRIANLTGCPIGAVVTAVGSGYVQASTTCTASAGGSTWQPIVGGALNTSLSITAAGSGYTIPPVVLIPAPPSPGVQATAYAVISSGTVSAVTVTNQGAGYPVAPSITVLPDPYDPNYGSVTNASLTAALTGSGAVTALLCTGNGAAQASAPTLTIAGVGASATATATMLWTGTGASVTAGGGGYGTTAEITTIGGVSSATAVMTNPQIEKSILKPRQAQMSLAASAGAVTSVASIYDGGLFTGTPTTLVLADAVVTTAATLALTLGSAPDTVTMQVL